MAKLIKKFLKFTKRISKSKHIAFLILFGGALIWMVSFTDALNKSYQYFFPKPNKIMFYNIDDIELQYFFISPFSIMLMPEDYSEKVKSLLSDRAEYFLEKQINCLTENVEKRSEKLEKCDSCLHVASNINDININSPGNEEPIIFNINSSNCNGWIRKLWVKSCSKSQDIVAPNKIEYLPIPQSLNTNNSIKLIDNQSIFSIREEIGAYWAFMSRSYLTSLGKNTLYAIDVIKPNEDIEISVNNNCSLMSIPQYCELFKNRDGSYTNLHYGLLDECKIQALYEKEHS